MKDYSDRKVMILGSEYTIHERDRINDPKLKEGLDGYYDFSNKTINICNLKEDEKSVFAVVNMQAYKEKLLRHEMIHAFLGESGLTECCDWATEEMVDWLAAQIPKLALEMQKVEILGIPELILKGE